MMRIGMSGFLSHPWRSVERTRQFYVRALGAAFELEIFDRRRKYDAVLNFSGPECWDLVEHPAYPLIFALHGGPVLDADFLRKHVKSLTTGDLLIVNCSSDLAILERLLPRSRPRLCLLPLPVDLSCFRPRPRKEARQILSIDSKARVIGFVGRLVPQKNLHQFLFMFAEIMRSVDGLTAIIVGDFWTEYPVLDYSIGDYRAYVGNLIEYLGVADRIQYRPSVLTDDMLANCLSAMDLLIHPTHSIDENFGYIAVEAMACGTPVVGAAYGGLKDTVVSGQTGFLMPTWATQSGVRMDVRAGISQAGRLLTDRELWHKMSMAAYERVQAGYSYEACARVLVDAVTDAIGQFRRAVRRPVETVAAPSRRQTFGLLPRIRRPWEQYLPQVSQYVSGPPPRLDGGGYVRLAAPLKAVGNSRFQLQDPTWPATFRLSARDLAVVSSCRDWLEVRSIRNDGGNVRERLRQLIRRGILICSV